MNWIIELTDKVLNGGEVTREEAERLINVSDDDTMLLLAMADKIRQKFNGNAVDCCAIINGRSAGAARKTASSVRNRRITIPALRNIRF